MNDHLHMRRGMPLGVAALCLPVAVALMLPSAAMAASSGGSTVRALVGGDGAVKSVKVLAADGSTSAFSGTLPLKLSISRTVSGNTSTYTYEVDNTFTKTQDVTYTDTAGKAHTFSQDLQLPLVAQLGVEVPSTFKNVTSSDGVVLTDPDGTNRILWNLVLFTPLGSPTQSVSFTAAGSGVPTAELAAQAVNPSTTSGLSSASQAATASSQQDDFWTAFASGGNGGLTQLAAGMTQMIAGLNKLAPGTHQLADGIKAAGAGAKLLDAGTKKAYVGSQALSSGLGQIHTGNASLATGLGQISGGLGQLADTSTGLPTAVTGLQTIQGALNKIIAAIGPTGSLTTPGLLDGLGAVDTGLKGSLTTLGTLAAGLTCAGNTIEAVVSGAPAGTKPTGCAAAIPVPLAGIADPFSQAVLVGSAATPGVALQLLGAAQLLTASLQAPTAANPNTLPAAIGAIEAVMAGLSHPATSASDPGGVKEVLTLLAGKDALGKAITGLQAAVTGVDALNTGAAAAEAGAQKLATGSGTAFTGSQALVSGLSQLSAGQHESATGLPAAVTGSAQIATGVDQVLAGAKQVKTGILAVQSGAVAPLQSQIGTGSQNAKKQLAILDASAALASQAPGGASSSYVLSQSPTGFKLAASTSAAKKSSDNTGRNIGIGIGGLVALVIAVVAGFALGRRSTSVSV